MKITDIVAFLESKAPAATAEEWDNPGLLADSGAKETNTVAVALDATPDAIRFASENGARLLITHHPVIFRPLSRIEADHPASLALKNGVSILCAHTNLDKAKGGVNDTLAARLLLEAITVAPDGMTRIGRLPQEMEPEQFAAFAAERLHTPVQFTGARKVTRVAVCGGGVGDGVFACSETADAFVTGEMKHHEFLAAQQSGLVAVAAGHYATEAPVVDTLTNWLRAQFPALSVMPFYAGAPYRVLIPAATEE